MNRIWEGKKECAHKPYYCGQVWNETSQLWGTVTGEYASEDDARDALAAYLQEQGE